MRQLPVAFQARVDCKWWSAQEMRASTGPRTGGVLCRPGPADQQGEMWKRGVSDPQSDLAHFICARPRRVAHAPLSGPHPPAQPGPASNPQREPYCGFVCLCVGAGANAGTSPHRLDSPSFGRNVPWR